MTADGACMLKVVLSPQ